MHNIYNKDIITKNGTLIDNWFEEDELRRTTGTTRSIRGFNYGKITFDPEGSHVSPSSHTLNIIYFFIIFLLIFNFLNYFYNFYF